ncbi:MAG: leucine-rich repeat protein [Clostridia bacterium]|nr:leucine-rich repeat protein [Clostridia bacterium]
MAKLKKRLLKVVSLLGASCFLLGACAESFNNAQSNSLQSTSNVSKTSGTIKTNQENYYDNDVIYKLPETVSQNDMVSVIVTMNTESVVDAYKETAMTKTVSEYARTSEARNVTNKVATKRRELLKKLNRSGIDYTLGEEYDTVTSGFEVTIKAKDYQKLGDLFKREASLFLGEVYEPAAVTEVITNEVDVYETGIFDSSKSEYQGDGVVVAVLDTGLDYTHTAFDVKNFEADAKDDAFTLSSVSSIVGRTAAAEFTSGLTGEDVYMNRKVPYAYDYADKDPDVLPINNEHGTHVAGIIAGHDDTIRGVAPNAQLAIMKVFSDTQDGAKDSWILAALEDCVTLGVDVINMSLGSGCGFATEEDNKHLRDIYDSIRTAGITLIASAANSYNATMGSEKNGNLGLTSNPDSGTVGQPSTFASALSVASVDGVKTPYFLYEDKIVYFTEATASDAKERDFVDDILNTVGENVDSHEFEYVTIPGLGEESDYAQSREFYEGKIVLVKRGVTTFEEKVYIALQLKGAAGIIIYNNVSGTISMSVGDSFGPVCSIAQEEGEMLAAAKTGKIKISRDQVAGPFMSDFSSWGPTSDLQIKPEITAHGGEILSAVPGQGYDRLSGTSMAAPNQAGAAALIRQYVKYSGVFDDSVISDAKQVKALVNQLMMSTADIIHNKNGLPYAIRKQGAGLVNIAKSTTAESYLTTFDKDGAVMDKTKLELGDDKSRTGVYEMSFAINNISANATTYDIGAIVITEGVSETYTSHDDTTVTQDGYLLSGAKMTVKSVDGVAANGNTVTVASRDSVVVTVEIVLSDADKQYMDDSFKYGMYVEGFITLDAKNGATVDLNVPLLAFYGDWTEAPIFDEEYYDTNKDELNDGLDVADKLMADAYATRVIGGLYSDYIATLGAYYFEQDPTSGTKIAASKDHIAISNQQNENNSAINSISNIWAGLLRNAKEVEISIVEDSTGIEVFNRTNKNQYKSFNRGGAVGQSSIEVDFSALEHELKNNTKYTVTVNTYIDYGEKSEQKNARNTFEFPLYVDFEAPVVTNVAYRTEYDETTKKTKLFADLDIYDNHYAMGLQMGQIVEDTDPDSDYTFSLQAFGKYVTPIHSAYNSTSTVTFELTDYVSKLKNSAGIDQDGDDFNAIERNNNSFIAICYDYALNSATYEIRLPDEIIAMYFTEESLNLALNETKDISDLLEIYPSDSWLQTLDFESSDPDVVDIINQTVIAKKAGTAVIKVKGYNKAGEPITAELPVTVDDSVQYDIPAVNKFEVTGYKVNKAYYAVSSDDREIGITDGVYDFGKEIHLSMFPSESVTLNYTLDSNFPQRTDIIYQSSDESIATVTQDGTIVAKAEGVASIIISIMFDDMPTLYSGFVDITVKDPYTTSGMYLMSYKGLGGEVVIPSNRGFTMIYSYAFSNYEFVEKDLDAGDEITDEDPYHLKQAYIGEDTITKVVIPEGVTTIDAYAFAGLTALEEVCLPKSLVRIGIGAFYGCEKLKTINLSNVKFINKEAFAKCALTEADLASVVAIGNYSFQDCQLSSLVLPKSSQSLGIGAFYGNKLLTNVEFRAPKMKIGSYAFAECTQLGSINVNAAVISSYAFYGCKELTNVNFGVDVSVIGEYAFTDTNVSEFSVTAGGNLHVDEENSALLLKNDELILVAPKGSTQILRTSASSIAAGAFAGNENLYEVIATNVTEVGAYAFAGCSILKNVIMPNVKIIGDYAFAGTNLVAIFDSETERNPSMKNVEVIGKYAFAGTKLEKVVIPNDTVIGDYAFSGYTVKDGNSYRSRYCAETLKEVVLGENVIVGEGAFYSAIYYATYENLDKSDVDDELSDQEKLRYYKEYAYYLQDEDGNYIDENGNIVADKSQAKTYVYYTYDFSIPGIIESVMDTVTVGAGTELGLHAFTGNANLKTLNLLGSGTRIGDYAFFNAASLKSVDLSSVESVGEYAFTGTNSKDYQYLKDLSGKSYVAQAYELVYRDGEEYIVNYKYTNFTSGITEIDLTSATSIGEGAFAGIQTLNSVTFGEHVKEIPAYAFVSAPIDEIVLPKTVTAIGDYAFYQTGLKQINLANVETIGEYAFAGTKLTEVSLKENAKISEGAFYNCKKLTNANGIEKVNSIGAESFAKTSLTELALDNVVVIGDFAFGESKVTKVSFGDKLEELGENPFYGCEIKTFGKIDEMIFGEDQVVGTKLNENYAISDKAQVIDGVLYQKIPTGLELVSYPMMKEQAYFKVQEGTTRITARAFAGSMLENVTLPSTLKALGDKALYDCQQLSVVVFTSYEAPILEEEYDVSYVSYENLPMNGQIGGYQGLGISKYYMWNVTANFSTFYFGANFVDHIGHIHKNLAMVVPANGQNYDSFIFGQYFSTTVAGSNAATQDTINVIGLINALPERITLSCESAIVAARNAYDSLASLEQKALVTNYTVLTNAESTLAYLKSREEQSTPGEPDPKPENPIEGQPERGVVGYVVAIVVLGVSVFALGGFVVVDKFVFKKKRERVNALGSDVPVADELNEKVNDEAAEETVENNQTEE